MEQVRKFSTMVIINNSHVHIPVKYLTTKYIPTSKYWYFINQLRAEDYWVAIFINDRLLYILWVLLCTQWCTHTCM